MVALKPMLNYRTKRGMTAMHDLIDWMGGFPYEFTKYELLVSYVESRGFKLVNGLAAHSLGCHELVFQRSEELKAG